MKTIARQFALLLIGLFLFIGLPLFGWGITDVSGFLRHPARVGYLVLTVVLQVITIVMVPNLGRQASEGKKLVRRQKLALLFLQILSLALVFLAPYSDRHGTGALVDAAWLRNTGLVLYPLGFLFAHWAQVRLDKQFSVQVTIQEEHKLITDGPYKFLWHPRYLGIILFSTGISMIFRSVAGLAIVALIAAVLVWRIHDEEALMRREFGDEWEAYLRRSWRMLPWIY